MATKKESDKAKVLQKRIAEDKARAREAESKTKKLWEQSNPAKFREQQEKEEVLRRRNEASQNESLRKLMLPRGIKEEREISIPPHSSQMTIRQYAKIYSLPLDQSLAHLNSNGFRCHAGDELKIPVRKMLDGLYRHQQALANRDKKLQEQTIETELKLQKESNTKTTENASLLTRSNEEQYENDYKLKHVVLDVDYFDAEVSCPSASLELFGHCSHITTVDAKKVKAIYDPNQELVFEILDTSGYGDYYAVTLGVPMKMTLTTGSKECNVDHEHMALGMSLENLEILKEHYREMNLALKRQKEAEQFSELMQSGDIRESKADDKLNQQQESVALNQQKEDEKDKTVVDYHQVTEWLHFKLKIEEKYRLHSLLGGPSKNVYQFDFSCIKKNLIELLPALARKELAEFLEQVVMSHNNPPNGLTVIINDTYKSLHLESEVKQQQKSDKEHTILRRQQLNAKMLKQLEEYEATKLKQQKEVEDRSVWQAQMGIQISTTHSPETKKALDSLSDRARKIQEATANLAKEKEVKDFRIERQKEANKPNGTEDITVSEYDRTEEWLHWNLKFEEKLKLHALLGGSLSEDFDFKRINRFVILPSLVRKELADFLGLVLLNHNSPPEEMALIIKEIRKSPCLESEEKQQKKAEDVAQSLYEKTSTDELVTVATALNSTGFIIPDSPSPNASIQLDMNRVDALKIESKKVTDMLGVLFEQDASSDILMPIQTQVDEPIADNENLLDLDNAHSNLIKLLCSRIQWSRAELEEIASDAGMMLDGALEHINDATYDTFDAALTEGDDPIDINQNILKELLK